MAQYTSVPTITEDALVEVRFAGQSAWTFLPGTATVSDSGGESPTRERITFSDIKRIVGKARPAQVEVAIPALAPGHSSYTGLYDAYTKKTSVEVRYQFKERVIGRPSATARVAITTDGTVTLSGSGATQANFGGDDIGPGAAFKTGTGANAVYDIIEEISAAGVPKCAKRAASLSAAEYVVVAPPWYRPPTLCRVSNFGNISADVESEAGTTLQLEPISVLPALLIGKP